MSGVRKRRKRCNGLRLPFEIHENSCGGVLMVSISGEQDSDGVSDVIELTNTPIPKFDLGGFTHRTAASNEHQLAKHHWVPGWAIRWYGPAPVGAKIVPG